ncbi:protein translocase subunit SecD [Gammaproteobacteria bacterium]|nr:protein translocase subunit SecD [Gammaproteobacteria bacterium]
MRQYHYNIHHIACILAVFFSLLYALPNLYPNVPVISVAQTQPDVQSINANLSALDIECRWLDQQTLAFNNIEEQMHAHRTLSEHGSEGEYSINLASTAPKWLSRIGAYPMKKGLDLQGGVHFLIKVDTQENKSQFQQVSQQQIEKALMDESIRFSKIEHAEVSNIELLDHTDTENAVQVLRAQGLQPSINSNSISWTAISQPTNFQDYAVEQTIDALNNRVNELGISEVQIARSGQQHISIDLPGVQDINYAKKIIGKTAALSFHLVTDPEQECKMVANKDGQMLPLNRSPILTGKSIIYANAQMSNLSPVVSIKLDGHAQEFYEATANHIGQPLAVVYSENKKVDLTHQRYEQVISAPVIRQPLFDQFVIQGVGTFEEAQELALILRSGALEAPIEFVEEIAIGPSMGEENITNGLLALAFGTIAISVFMVFYYGKLGMAANIALYLNILITISGLSILGATLTLPGIAGLVLSVGMAVDANVLINERIREELEKSSQLKTAIKKGYEKALTAIIDANVTTILVTLVLFYMGSGAIKGFAVTTCVGIIASMFTAVYFTQNVSLYLIDRKWIERISFQKVWFKSKKEINFMANKHLAFSFSSMIFIFSVSSLMHYGIHLGLDFTGGSQIVIESDAHTLSTEQIRQTLKAENIIGAQVQNYGADNVFMIKIPEKNELSQVFLKRIELAITDGHIIQTAFIGPQVGKDMLFNGLIAMVSALCISLAYVAIRFEYRFAMSAIISLIHDPILILGIFSFFQIEFDLITLAAMLTIIGYSINDTIVVYDRVREHLTEELHINTSTCVNQAINQTLSRTILTSGLTLLAVLSIYTFGGDYLRGFSVALSIGIVIGTYSSIYIAGSLAVLMGLKKEDLLPSPSGATL